MALIKLIIKYHGLREWLLVRLSAILIVLYIVYLLSFILFSYNLSYETWCNFFSNNIIKICSTVVLLLILVHTWIGMRHILEDYIKSILLRRFGIGLIRTILYIYLLLGITIIWGIKYVL